MTLPSHYRARHAAINALLTELKREEKDAPPTRKKTLQREVATLRSGAFPEGFDPDEQIALLELQYDFPNDPLTDLERMTYSTFFEIHPHKIAGVEGPTGFREAPLAVSGTRADVEAAIGRTLPHDPLEDLARHLLNDLEHFQP